MNEKSLLYKLNLLEEVNDKNILDELYNETSPHQDVKYVDTPIPSLTRLSNGKYKFQDGKKEYNSPESAKNAISGFRKFQDKREETTQLIHKKKYEDLQNEMTEDELKDYNKSISGKNV